MSDDWPERLEIPPVKEQAGLWGESFPPVLKRAPKSGAQRVADLVARRSDLGELPPVRDPERRARCAGSLREFAAVYCSHLFDHEPSARLLDYAATLQAAIEGAGQVHVRCARGAGKTTWVKAALAWGLATGRLHYAVVFCASADLTAGILGDVWDVYEFDAAFGEDWPEVAFPIRAAEGLPQRYQGQHYHGRRTQIRRSAREIRLPTIEGAASSGGVLLGRGAGSKTRGLVRGKRRPDMVLLDDIQSREDARNPRRVRELSAWIDGDVQGLTGSRLLNAVMTSTPIVAGDLSATYSDGGQHPEWRRVEYRLVEGEPEHPELWERYDELWRAARREGEMEFRAASAWYAEHRAEMDAGLDVLDPLNYDRRLELSGIQHARNLLLTMGGPAFRAEYQLTVRASEDEIKITPRLVAERLSGLPRGVLPPRVVGVVGAVDVNLTRYGLSWLLLAVDEAQACYVVDYGRYPGGNRRLVPEGLTQGEIERHLSAGLAKLLRQIYVPAQAATSRMVMQPPMIGVDLGYLPRTVQTVVRTERAVRGLLCIGMRGRGHGRIDGKKQGERLVKLGAMEGVQQRRADDGAWIAFDADLFRERFQRGWFGPPGTEGSVCLFGADASEHMEFAEEVCSETLVEKLKTKNGEDIFRWQLRPGAQNHFLDAGVMALALAGYYGFVSDRVVSPRRHVEPLAPRGATSAPANPATVAGSTPRRVAARRARFRSPTMAS